MVTPEGNIKRKLDNILKDIGVWYYSPQAGPFGKAGIPDRVAIVKGKFIGIECKADRTKKPTALQLKTMKEIEEQGGKCFYTGIPIDEDNLAGDHYIPRSFGIDAGGVTEYDNLVVCTKGLNLRKLNMHGDDFVKLLKKESEQAA